MTVKMEKPKWILVASLYLIVIFFCEVIFLASARPLLSHKNAVIPHTSYTSLTTKEALQRRLLKGREVIPALSNAIPGEPSCEELRAMWRYYKRQSRAELTNEIPRFGSNLFWDVLPVAPPQPQISSFGPLKGRLRNRLRLKNAKSSPVYGRVVYKPERERERARKPRPMEQVAKLMGKPKSDQQSGRAKNEEDALKEPIVHYSPPPTPTKASSLQQIKDIFREERIREQGPAMRNNNDDNGKTFGRIMLSPPKGSDGRMANKPKELMTPFEKIRFGHADDALDYGAKPALNLMAKRRTLPIHVLKQQQQQEQQYPRQYLLPRPSRMDTVTLDDPVVWTQRDLLDDKSNVYDMPQSNDDPWTSFIPEELEIDSNGNWLSLPLSEDSIYDSNKYGMINPSGNDVMMIVDQNQNLGLISPPEIPIVMDNPSPTCAEVEGQSCKVNSDCSCVGFGLYRCYIDQCQVISLQAAAGVGDEGNLNDRLMGSSSGGNFPTLTSTSLWHSGPVQKNQLGIWEETNSNSGNDDNNNDTNDDYSSASFNADNKNSLNLFPAVIGIEKRVGNSSKSSSQQQSNRKSFE